LLVAFGGPERPADVRPFLDNVLRGRPVPPARYEEVVHHYEVIGGRSPLNALTLRQAAELETLLRAEGPGLPVYVGMRNWTPYVADTLARMRDDGIRHALAIVLAAHRTEASWERYQETVAAARAALGDGAPVVAYAPSWHAHPRFVEAVADRTRAALEALAPPSGGAAPDLVFTAHSIPVAMAAVSPYVQELETSCRLVAAALGGRDFTLAYQSRSGNPREPWLEPDVNDLIRARAARGTRAMVVVPIGFVCDHVEVLYDLDVEARATADAAGIRLVRAAAVNDHPAFVRMLAEVVRAGAG
jgi:ferrochelatase